MSEDYEIPDDLLYSKDHHWVRLKKKVAELGITDYAQKKLRDIIYVELPSPNQKIKQGDTLCTIESVKAVTEITSPISGRMLEVNSALLSKPELINESPYEEGWIVRIEVSNAEELDRLMDPDEYARYIEALEEEAEEEE